MNIEFIQAVLTAIPTGATLVTAWLASRQTTRSFAKQSILQLILEDQFNWTAFKQFPRNYVAIIKEYDSYHKNGGNGEITRKVEAYIKWYGEIEKQRG